MACGMLYRNIPSIILILQVLFFPSALASVASLERRAQQLYRAVREAQAKCNIEKTPYLKAGESFIERFKLYSKLNTADGISEEFISCLTESLCSTNVHGSTDKAWLVYKTALKACSTSPTVTGTTDLHDAAKMPPEATQYPLSEEEDEPTTNKEVMLTLSVENLVWLSLGLLTGALASYRYIISSSAVVIPPKLRRPEL